MKYIIVTTLSLLAISAYGQQFDTVLKIIPCKWDTTKGFIYYSSKENPSDAREGYYISKCGGFRIGPYWGYDDAPVWIPGKLILCYKEKIGKKWVEVNYVQQNNAGYFTDENFKKLPIESVYGMMVLKRLPDKMKTEPAL